MSDRALTYVADFSGIDGDAEVRKSTLWTPYRSTAEVSVRNRLFTVIEGASKGADRLSAKLYSIGPDHVL